MDEGEKMKRNMLKRQMKKVTLKFWNNMIVLSVLMLLLVGSVSAADTALSESDPVTSVSDDVTISSEEMEGNVYTVQTKDGSITVEVLSGTLNKKATVNNQELVENDNELFIIHRGKLTTISIENKKNAQKMLVNAVELLVEKETIENPVFSQQKEFVVMVDRTSDFSYERELLSSENYQFVVVKTNDLSTLSNRDSIIKISEISQEKLRKFVQFSQDTLSAESLVRIRELELKKSTLDCLEPRELNVYMEEEGWDTQSGQSSPYQQFVTPGNSVVQGLSNGKTVQKIYEMAVGWTWVSDNILNGKTEKWLLPAEFLSGTPSYSTNPSYGNVASDCSEQANTLVSLLRASSVAAEDVRVVLGKVDFDGSIGGHAWVEIKEDGRWMVLDATCGPYYDEESEEVVSRGGVNYGYWKYHSYPEVEVWCYYNDVYFTDENEEVADGWSTQYDAEENFLAGFAGLLSEVSFDPMFVYIAMTIAAIISVVSLVMLKKKDSGK